MCLFLRLLFTFYVKTAGKDAKARKLVAVRTQERAQLANQILGFRITDRSDA